MYPVCTPVEPTSATSPAGLQLPAVLQQHPSVGLSADLMRIKAKHSDAMMTSIYDVGVSRSALADALACSNALNSSIRSSGSQACPGTPHGVGFMSPARALGIKQKAFARDDASLGSHSSDYSARAVGSSLRPLASVSPNSGSHEADLLGSTSPAPAAFSPTPFTNASIADSMASIADDVFPAAAPLQLTPLQMPAQRIGSPTTSISVRSVLGHSTKTPCSHASSAGSNSRTRDSAMQTEGHLL